MNTRTSVDHSVCIDPTCCIGLWVSVGKSTMLSIYPEPTNGRIVVGLMSALNLIWCTCITHCATFAHVFTGLVCQLQLLQSSQHQSLQPEKYMCGRKVYVSRLTWGQGLWSNCVTHAPSFVSPYHRWDLLLLITNSAKGWHRGFYSLLQKVDGSILSS